MSCCRHEGVIPSWHWTKTVPSTWPACLDPVQPNKTLSLVGSFADTDPFTWFPHKLLALQLLFFFIKKAKQKQLPCCIVQNDQETDGWVNVTWIS